MFTYGGPLLGVYFHIPFWGVHFHVHFWKGSTSMFTSGGSTSVFTSGGSTSMFPSRGVHFHVHFWGGPLSCSPCDLSHTALIYHYRMPSASWAKFTCSSGSRISHRGVLTLWGFQLPRQLRFKKFVCQMKESGPVGGMHWQHPWICH